MSGFGELTIPEKLPVQGWVWLWLKRLWIFTKVILISKVSLTLAQVSRFG
jgi:hypothetical protein